MPFLRWVVNAILRNNEKNIKTINYLFKFVKEIDSNLIKVWMSVANSINLFWEYSYYNWKNDSNYYIIN